MVRILMENIFFSQICFADYRSNGYEPSSFGNDVLENIIREKPACSNTLKYLVIIPAYIYKVSYRVMVYKTAVSKIEHCTKIQKLV